jgi:hypothetical protein
MREACTSVADCCSSCIRVVKQTVPDLAAVCHCPSAVLLLSFCCPAAVLLLSCCCSAAVLQDHLGRAEGYNIVHADKQFIVPTDGKPIRGLIQDHVVAGVEITCRCDQGV